MSLLFVILTLLVFSYDANAMTKKQFREVGETWLGHFWRTNRNKDNKKKLNQYLNAPYSCLTGVPVDGDIQAHNWIALMAGFQIGDKVTKINGFTIEGDDVTQSPVVMGDFVNIEVSRDGNNVALKAPCVISRAQYASLMLKLAKQIYKDKPLQCMATIDEFIRRTELPKRNLVRWYDDCWNRGLSKRQITVANNEGHWKNTIDYFTMVLDRLIERNFFHDFQELMKARSALQEHAETATNKRHILDYLNNAFDQRQTKYSKIIGDNIANRELAKFQENLLSSDFFDNPKISSLKNFQSLPKVSELVWDPPKFEPKGKYETDDEYAARIAPLIKTNIVQAYHEQKLDGEISQNNSDFVSFCMQPFYETLLSQNVSKSNYIANNAYGAESLVEQKSGNVTIMKTKWFSSPWSDENWEWGEPNPMDGQSGPSSRYHSIQFPLPRDYLKQNKSDVSMIRTISVDMGDPRVFSLGGVKRSASRKYPTELDLVEEVITVQLDTIGLYDRANEKWLAILSPDLVHTQNLVTGNSHNLSRFIEETDAAPKKPYPINCESRYYLSLWPL